MNDGEKNSPSWKGKAVHEIRRFIFNFLFLALFFSAFTLYRSLVLEEYDIRYFHYGFNLIEALILAKIILIGQSFKLGEKYADRSLIIPTCYKTFVFTLFVLIFGIIEHFLVGFFYGRDLKTSYQELLSKGLDQILASLLIMVFVFFFFFAFMETGRVLGEDKLGKLFFDRKKLDDSNLSKSL